MTHVALTRLRKQNSSLRKCDVPIVFSQSWIRAFRSYVLLLLLRCKKRPGWALLSQSISDIVTKNSYCWDRDGSSIGAALDPQESTAPIFFTPSPVSPKVGANTSTMNCGCSVDAMRLRLRIF